MAKFWVQNLPTLFDQIVGQDLISHPGLPTHTYIKLSPLCSFIPVSLTASTETVKHVYSSSCLLNIIPTKLL